MVSGTWINYAGGREPLVSDNRQAVDQINHGSQVPIDESDTLGIEINYYKYDGTDYCCSDEDRQASPKRVKPGRVGCKAAGNSGDRKERD